MKNPIVFFTLLHFSMASVHIACAQIINTFPHTEDFEAFTLCSSNCAAACSLSGGWVNAAGDQTDWIVFSGATPTMNTGPDFDHTLGNSLGKYLYVESTGCTNATASLLSPSIDLSGQTNVSFDFWYHMYGNNLSTLHVDVSTDGGINFTDDMVPSWMANSNAWQKTTIPLDAYAGDTVIIRVRGVTGNGSLSDLAVDDFRFYIVQGNDAGIVRVDSPVNPLTPGLQNVVVTLQNFGTSVLTSAGIGWNVDGAAQTPYAWSGNLSTGQTETVTIGSYTFPAGISALKVWSYAPNGMTDEGPANDTVEYTLCTGLSGTYTIGGGGDFPGLLEAVSALVTCGISGAVTFNVLPGSGPFLQQLDIPQIAGASALNA
ncbi:MAG TPA: choice-of-anchor J domain-containing protein, partial [Chitinophagales bacterium]|nr:choice-of-anchor J domain-containing protein [Chitinophagales bacterium]